MSALLINEPSPLTIFRWVCVRIEVLAGLFSSGLAAYLVYWGGVSASNTGFALTMAGELESNAKAIIVAHVP